MKQSVWVLAMANRAGFTLIEVMVSVLIISTVVMALYSMSANSGFIYTKSIQDMKTNGYLSFLVANKNYGFDNISLDLDRLLEGYELENELRKELKATKVSILYEELQTIDMSKFDMKETPEYKENTKEQNQAQMLFEIGRTSLLFKEKSNASLLRLRIP